MNFTKKVTILKIAHYYQTIMPIIISHLATFHEYQIFFTESQKSSITGNWSHWILRQISVQSQQQLIYEWRWNQLLKFYVKKDHSWSCSQSCRSRWWLAEQSTTEIKTVHCLSDRLLAYPWILAKFCKFKKSYCSSKQVRWPDILQTLERQVLEACVNV